MNRVIKFRGKRTDGLWNYGRNIRFKQDGTVCIQGAVVDPETVGQFTGLHDATGREIYEGDILREGETGNTLQVVYDAPEFCFKDNAYGYRFLNHAENFKVIGNVYDNPELLKGGEQ